MASPGPTIELWTRAIDVGLLLDRDTLAKDVVGHPEKQHLARIVDRRQDPLRYECLLVRDGGSGSLQRSRLVSNERKHVPVTRRHDAVRTAHADADVALGGEIPD